MFNNIHHVKVTACFLSSQPFNITFHSNKESIINLMLVSILNIIPLYFPLSSSQNYTYLPGLISIIRNLWTESSKLWLCIQYKNLEGFLRKNYTCFMRIFKKRIFSVVHFCAPLYTRTMWINGINTQDKVREWRRSKGAFFLQHEISKSMGERLLGRYFITTHWQHAPGPFSIFSFNSSVRVGTQNWHSTIIEW